MAVGREQEGAVSRRDSPGGRDHAAHPKANRVYPRALPDGLLGSALGGDLSSREAGRTFRVFGFPDPFAQERWEGRFRVGSTIDDVVKALEWADSRARVMVGSAVIPSSMWPRVKPRPGTTVVVRAYVGDPISATIAVLGTIASFAAEASAVVGSVLSGAGVLGSLATTLATTASTLISSSLIAFFGPKIFGLVGDAADAGLGGGGATGRQSPSFSGVGNSILKGFPLPDVYGIHRVFPPLLAQAYTEAVGGEVFVRLLLGLSYGPVTVSDILVGEVPIEDIPDADWQVREGRPSDDPIEIYTQQVFQNAPGGSGFQFPLAAANETADGDPQISAVPGTKLKEISVEIRVGGLLRLNENGKRRAFGFGVRLRYRNGSDAFVDAVTASGFTGLGGDGNVKVITVRGVSNVLEFSGFTQESFIKTLRWRVPEGSNYQVEMTRLETNPSNARPRGRDASSVIGGFAWTAVRGFSFDPPFTIANYATLAVRLPITDSIGGRPGNISCVVSRELRIYDPRGTSGLATDADGWTTTETATRNPAAAIRNQLQGAQNLNPADNAQIDIAGLSAFYQDCEPAAFDSLDDSSIWTGSNATLSDEGTVFVEGGGSIKAVSTSSSADATMSLSGLDLNIRNQVLAVFIRIEEAAGLSATQGVRLRLYSSPADYIDFEFGTDKLTESEFGGLLCNPAVPTVSVGAFDPDHLADIDLSFNTISGNQAAGRTAYWDDLRIGRFRGYSSVHDFKSSVREQCIRIARSADAVFYTDNMKASVKADRSRDTVVQLITPQNSTGFSSERAFAPRLHGVKVIFTHENKGYEPQFSQFVPNDGFTEATADPGKVETIRFTEAFGGREAYIHGRRLLAQRELQPRIYRLTMGLDALVANVGDVVHYSHQEALVGQMSGLLRLAESVTEVDDADSATDWGGQAATVAVDTSEKVEGTGSIAATATGTSAFGVRFFPPGGAEDWSATTLLRVYVRPPDDDVLTATDGVRIAMFSAGASSTWYFGTDINLRAGRWRRVTLDTGDAPDASTGGGVDLSGLIEVRFTFRNQSTAVVGEVARVDLLERLDPTEVATLELTNPVSMEGGTEYEIMLRVLDESVPAFSFILAPVTNPLGAMDPAQLFSRIDLATPVTSGVLPVAGNLYAFGETGVTVIPMLVAKIERGSDLSAQLTLVDYNESIYASDRKTIPAFSPAQSLVPVAFRGPAKPTIAEIITDERALAFNESGSLVPRIVLVMMAVPESGRPEGDEYEVQFRVNDSAQGTASAFKRLRFPIANKLVIEDVEEGVTYDVKVRLITASGATSEFSSETVLVIGKSTPPSDVTLLRVEGDNLVWNYPFGVDGNIDLDGFDIRFNPGVDLRFENAQRVMSDGNLVKSPPFPLARSPRGLQTGVYTALIKAVDKAGNQSLNAASLILGLGAPITDNIVETIDLAAQGFPRVEVPLLFENFDDDLGLWVESGITIAEERVKIEEGFGAYSLTLDAGSLGSIKRSLTTVEDWTDRDLTFHARVESAALSGGDGVRMRVESSVSDYVEFRFGTADGLSVGDGLYKELAFNISDSPDASGGSFDVTSVSAVSIYIGAVAPLAGDLVYVDRFEHTGGTAETTQVNSGDLVTITTDKFWSGDDNALFWSGNDSDLFWTAVYETGLYHFLIDDLRPVAPCDLSFLWDEPGVSAKLEYRRLGSTNPFWSGNDDLPFWSSDADLFWTQVSREDFAVFPGTMEVGAEDFEFRLTMIGGPAQGRISQLKAVLDVPDLVESFDSLTVPAAGLRVPITKDFRAIREVRASFNSSSGTARFLDVSDYSAELGPLIKFLNSFLVAVEGTAGVEVKGY